MRIHFVRSGGFAGMRLASTIDTHTLDPGEVQALTRELEDAHFFELPQQLSGGTGMDRDRFQYEITVEDGARKHTITAGESALTGSLQPLVQHIEALARTSSRH